MGNASDVAELGSEVARLRKLIRHAWVHSGYPNCGYDQMTTEQKSLYAAVIASDAEAGNARLREALEQIVAMKCVESTFGGGGETYYSLAVRMQEVAREALASAPPEPSAPAGRAASESAVTGWREKFAKTFVMSGRNSHDPEMLFRVWGNGTMSIALPEHVQQFIEIEVLGEYNPDAAPDPVSRPESADRVAELEAEVASLKSIIEGAADKSPAGYDWSVLGKIDELEAEHARLRERVRNLEGGIRRFHNKTIIGKGQVASVSLDDLNELSTVLFAEPNIEKPSAPAASGGEAVVDLSVCEERDECHLRDGRTERFKGLADTDWKHSQTHPFVVGVHAYSRAGRYCMDQSLDHPVDIIRVTRVVDDKVVQVTPAPSPAVEFDFQSMDAQLWAKAFCQTFHGHDEGTMLAWFANAIMAGYDEACRRERREGTPAVEAGVESDGVKVGAGIFGEDEAVRGLLKIPGVQMLEGSYSPCGDVVTMLDNLRSKANAGNRTLRLAYEILIQAGSQISAPSSPSEPPESEGSAAVGDCGIVAAGPQKLAAGTPDDLFPAPPSPATAAVTAEAAVIVGAGRYRTAEYDRTGKEQWLADVAGKLVNGVWVGECNPAPREELQDSLILWLSSGMTFGAHDMYRITGPYSPPKLVLELPDFWFVEHTQCFPCAFWLRSRRQRDNATRNYFRTAEEAWAVADERNAKLVAQVNAAQGEG